MTGNGDTNDVPEPVDGEGSEAQSSDPISAETPKDNSAASELDSELDGGELTVDDILNVPQDEDAIEESDAEAEDVIDEADAIVENSLVGDLKRVQAEYANYRRRTEEQRQIEVQRARGEAARALLPVLDDLDRAAQHGDLVQGTPFAAISEKVRAAVQRLGVTSYGEKGDVFDPQQHEAIFQQPTQGITVPAVLDVVEVGYRIGEIELRPAKVVVATPTE